MTKLTIVRHGETEWNKIGKQQGHLDSPLTKNGIIQAKAIAGFIDNDFDFIISSDLGRAIETAKIIAEKIKKEIIKEKGLRERNLGILHGLTMKEFQENFPEEFKKLISYSPDYKIPEGESIKERFERTISALNKLVNKYSGKNLLIVCHGGNLDSIFRYTLNIPLNKRRNFSLINASINKFIYDNGWKILSWGETGHLKGLVALDDF